ncbi:uncharacterized protein TM35_000141440 [Trypanosoma theileri]|uniref:Uncharacterized protein n=1 Tax=Trypanosoma theileri TaxID=67003 RepID=A0A1X0NWT1_9TRYP|nr:uncharacterized protein TM35_000141440 [Trypanosoma theileri]ORC88933.1 hypothetical protein TM35_000141440 [Trypanosoma theileri]
MAARAPNNNNSSNRNENRREKNETDPVPVQMTSLVPVRVVSVHGDFFDTELHQDAPLRILQSAVEDCFKVRPELQLLTHNRQQINTNVSLRRNGCLLLKGDPYVKIVLDIKKGTKLNLVCQMAHTEPIPLACESADTVWEVKKKFCAALGKVDLTPQRIRLLWRYWELNDKATLDYYHLPTNAKLSVMKKRGFATKPQQQQEEKRVTNSSKADAGTKSLGDAGIVGLMHHRAPSNNSNTAAGARTLVNEKNRAVTDIAASSTSIWPSHSKQYGRAVIPIDSTIDYGAAATPTEFRDQAHALPVQGGELVKLSQTVPLSELNRLKQEIASLERRIELSDADRAGYQLLEESYRATLGRVTELEATLGRFQHLLKRALTLM